ncbi:MAG: O-antigen ligase family protein, partial [Sedimentisphaerales bacterium]|nr:O-antigen ligase family protein [Sedimentisphaerales bacterium]
AACMLGCSLMLIIAAMRLQKSIVSKVFIYTFMFVLLLGMLLTKSRSGLLSLMGTIVLMGVFGRSKKVAWLVIIAAITISMTFGGFREAFLRRIQRTSSIKEDTSVVGRFQTWSNYFKTATAKTYLVGQGVSRARELTSSESHSSYVSLITVYGIGGVIWAAIALIIFFRRALVLRNFPDPLISAVSAGCMWALITWGIYSATADALNSVYSRYLLFYLVILIDRAYNIARQQQGLLLYDGEVEDMEMQYAGAES